MHPKAALLALHGFLPFVNGAPKALRVKRGVDYERMLAPDHNDRWEITNSAPPSCYQPVAWECISDRLWNMLPDYLVDEFIQTC